MEQAKFDEIIDSGNLYLIRNLASEQDLTEEMLHRLYAISDSELQASVVALIRDASIVEAALTSRDPLLIRCAVRNPITTEAQLALASKIVDPDVIHAVARNPKSSYESLENCLSNIHCSKMPYFILGAIVQNPQCTEELVERIFTQYGIPLETDYAYNSFLESLALSTKSSVKILDKLTEIEDKSYNRSLTVALINNPKVTLDMQRNLFYRGTPDDRVAITEATGTHKELLEEIIAQGDVDLNERIVVRKNLPEDLFEILFSSSSTKVRAAFARRDDLTRAHILAMVADKGALVREAIAYYDLQDLALLEPLTQDESVKVSAAMTSLKKRDKTAPPWSDKLIDAPERRELAEAATLFKSGVKPKKRPETIGDRVAAIKVEKLSRARFDELSKEDSVTIRVAAIMRGHELGLIDLKSAVDALNSAGTPAVAPREAWLLDRAQNWQKEPLRTALDMQFWFKSSLEVLLRRENSLPEDFLIQVINIRYGKYNWAIYQNQKITKAMLLAFVNSEMFYSYSGNGKFVQIEMLKNPLIDSDIYKALTSCKFKVVREALFADKNTPREILEIGLEDKDGEIRGGVIANERFAFKEIERFIKDRGFASKVGVLRRRDCPAELLAEFAENKQLEVRLTVASNPSTPIDSLMLLAGDDEKTVRNAASSNPSATAEVKAIATLLA